MDKEYKVQTPGTGRSPQVLVNTKDETDKIFVCGCGGMKNKDGFCDGSHKKKAASGCGCDHSTTEEDRTN